MATIIDNGATGFTTVGNWGTYQLAGNTYYGSNYHFNAAGSGADKAIWTFSGLANGTYRVSVAWATNSSHATNAPYSILVGGVSVFTTTKDQRVAPAADVFDVVNFEDLSSGISVTGGTLVVELTDNASGTVTADAVRIELVSSGSSSSNTAGTQVYPFRQWVEDDFGGGASGGGSVFHPLA